MKEIDTKHGVLKGITYFETYPDGKLKNCKVNTRNVIKKEYALLIPQFEDSEARRKDKSSISFYQNGEIKSISLNKKTEIKTKTGVYSAERILFYESGEIKCIFPLDGKVTGYWSEEDEYELAENFSFDLKCGKIKNKVINIRFYKDEAIKNITLWPGEKAVIKIPEKELEIRTGLSLYPDGSLESCEPDYPTPVQSPIGNITAYDCNALGINADLNSLSFSQSGQIKSLKTSTDIIEIIDNDGAITTIKPGLKPHLFNNKIKLTEPISIKFEEGFVYFNVFNKSRYKISDFKFIAKNNAHNMESQCSNCQIF